MFTRARFLGFQSAALESYLLVSKTLADFIVRSCSLSFLFVGHYGKSPKEALGMFRLKVRRAACSPVLDRSRKLIDR